VNSDGNARTIDPALGWLLALTATATMTISYIDRQAIAVLSPTLSKALDIDDATWGWIFSAFSIAYLVGAPLGGRFIDRIGARRGLLASVLIWSGVSAAHALVPGIATLFLLRILLGISESPAFPAAAQTVSRSLPPTQRSAAFGLLFTGSSIGAMIAPPLITWLEYRYHWRYALLATAVICLLWLPLWLLVSNFGPARVALDAPPERARSDDFSWIALLTSPAVVRAVLVVLASAPLTGFVLLWGAKILVGAFQITQKDVGHYLWLPGLIFDVGAVGLGALASYREHTAPSEKPHRVLLGIALLLTTTIAGLRYTTTPWETTILLGVAMAGGGGLYALATADMLRRVAPGHVAAAGGVTAAAQSLAYIVANPIIGAVSRSTHTFNGVATALGIWVIPGCLIWLWWDPSQGNGARRAAP
jgi:ACS family hexuronate transporter-like MFS transporter